MRISLLALPAAMLLAACAAPAVEPPATESQAATDVAPPTAESSPTRIIESASGTTESDTSSAGSSDCGDPFEGMSIRFLPRFWPDTDFCTHSVDYHEISSGGPPPDGIPSIDNPIFESIAAGDEWLGEDWPVMIFEHNQEVRAYPLAILVWHEIVNDEFDGQPIVLTFCPLCNSTIVFNGLLEDGTILKFGTTGNLRNSDLVMYDRTTFSWWQQFTGEAIVGELTGTVLEFLPSQIISWGDFKANYSDAQVLSRETGHGRSYGSNPYAFLNNPNSPPIFPVTGYGGDLPASERVVSITLDGVDIAFPFSTLRELLVVNEEIAGQPLVVFWKAGTRTTYGNSDLDVGSSGVFSRRLGDQLLTFEHDGDGFRDIETGSRWTIAGEAVEGELRGSSLERLVSGEHFWFSWSVFKPETVVWQP
jgi:hypothetical protein